jgi:hypothetical protein
MRVLIISMAILLLVTPGLLAQSSGYPECSTDFDSRCPSGENYCDGGFCVECKSPSHCSGKPYCVGGYCAECLSYSDCTYPKVCQSNSCVSPPLISGPCRSDIDCGPLVCNRVSFTCTDPRIPKHVDPGGFGLPELGPLGMGLAAIGGLAGYTLYRRKKFK